MTKHRKTAYCLASFALATMLLMASAVLSVSDSMARVDNTAEWQTVMPSEQVITSKCLMPEGQTILLGALDLTQPDTKVVITIQSKYATTGNVTFHCDREDLLKVVVLTPTVVVDGVGTAELVLIPTEAAHILTETTSVNIDVTFVADGQILEGQFQAVLEATVPETEATPETETTTPETGTAPDAETTPDTDTDTPTPEGSEENQENTETITAALLSMTGASEPTLVDNTDVGNGTGESENTNGESNSGETGSDGSNSGENTGNEDTSGGTTDGGTNEDETSEELPKEPELLMDFLLNLNAPSNFSLAGKVPVSLALPTGCTGFALSMSGGMFPAFTRYSADGGDTWFMLYYGGMIESVPTEAAWLDLLLDFSYTDKESWNLGTTAITFSATAFTEAGWYVDSVGSMVFADSDEFAEDAVILNADEILYVPVTANLYDCQSVWTVELLMEDHSWQLVEVNLVGSGFYIAPAGEYMLSVSTAEVLPQAGTYRLTIQYSYLGWQFDQSQFTFFVNYANGAQQALGGTES